MIIGEKKIWISCQILHIAKSAERQKKETILGDGLAKQSEPQQCKFKLESLESNSPAVQARVV